MTNSNDDGPGNSRQTLAALVVVVILAAAGWWLMTSLQHHNDVQNCIASGRHDCVPVDTGQ